MVKEIQTPEKDDIVSILIYLSMLFRGGSRTPATSKIEVFVTIAIASIH